MKTTSNQILNEVDSIFGWKRRKKEKGLVLNDYKLIKGRNPTSLMVY
jgi:hypothetical protein